MLRDMLLELPADFNIESSVRSVKNSCTVNKHNFRDCPSPVNPPNTPRFENKLFLLERIYREVPVCQCVVEKEMSIGLGLQDYICVVHGRVHNNNIRLCAREYTYSILVDVLLHFLFHTSDVSQSGADWPYDEMRNLSLRPLKTVEKKMTQSTS